MAGDLREGAERHEPQEREVKLPAAYQQIVDSIIDEAHAEHGGVPRDVSEGIVERLTALEGSGEMWVAAYNHDLLVSGAARLYSDWRRRYEINGKTKAGTPVTVPAFGGVTRKDDDGVVVHVQMALEGMTLAELREMRNRKARMRDTLSGEIKVYDALIDLMVEKNLACAGDALALIQKAAA